MGWAKFYIIGVFRRFVVVYWNLANSNNKLLTKQQRCPTGMYIWVWCVYTSTYGVGFVLLVLDWKAMLEPWKRNCNNGVPLFLWV